MDGLIGQPTRANRRRLIEEERAVLAAFWQQGWNVSDALVRERSGRRFSSDRPRLRRTLGRLWAKGLVEPDADDVRRGFKRYWRLTPAGVAAQAAAKTEGATHG